MLALMRDIGFNTSTSLDEGLGNLWSGIEGITGVISSNSTKYVFAFNRICYIKGNCIWMGICRLKSHRCMPPKEIRSFLLEEAARSVTALLGKR